MGHGGHAAVASPGGPVARWSILAAAVASMLGGVATAGDDRLAAALFAVGWVLLGAYVALTIRDQP